MNIYPIVERELRVAARKPATYYARVSACIMVMLFALPMLLFGGGISAPRQLGATMFETMIWVSFGYAMLVGISATSDCISSEKREGTLGLLFLTDLTGMDVVLGKLAANSLAVVYGLLAVIPIFAITFMLGGVTSGQVARVALALFNAMFFSLSASLLASSVSRDARRAGSVAFLLLLFFVALVPAAAFGLGAFLRYKGFAVAEESVELVFLFNPAYVFSQVASVAGFGGAKYFWSSLAGSHALAWGFLWLASRIVPRTWQDKPATIRRLRWRDRLRNWLQGDAVTRKGYRQRLLELNPVSWLASRDRLKPVYPWCFMGIVFGTWILGLVGIGKEWLGAQGALVTMGILHLVFRLWMASEASLCFGENLRSGALELVLSTSLTVEEILRGQVLALRRQFFWPAIAVLATDLVLLFLAFAAGSFDRIGERIYLAVTVLGAMAMFAADMHAIAWTSMWHALHEKELKKASGAAVSKILFLPWAYYFGGVIVGGMLGIPLLVEFGFGLIFWLFIGLINDLYFMESSRSKLRLEFRSMAMRRYSGEAPKTIWQRLGVVRE